MSRLTRASVVVVGLVVAVAVFRPTSVETQGAITTNQRIATLETQVATLKSQVTALLAADTTQQGNITAEAAARETADTGLQAQINNVPIVPQDLLDVANYVSVDLNTINDLVGPHVIFSGANVHIQNGNGNTDFKNGLGNLIVGYNETVPGEILRDGSHNIAVGWAHGYSSWGGLVAGFQNIISGPFASVSGGGINIASGFGASVSGGERNTASNINASVSGGFLNGATGVDASVSGGLHNTASGETSTVSGGKNNTASGLQSTVSGGAFNVASDPSSLAP